LPQVEIINKKHNIFLKVISTFYKNKQRW